MALKKPLGKFVHGMPGRSGSAVFLERLVEGDDEFSGFPSRPGRGHRAGVAERGVADAPADVVAKKERARTGGPDAHAKAADNIIPDLVFLVRGLGSADASGESGFRFFGQALALAATARKGINDAWNV